MTAEVILQSKQNPFVREIRQYFSRSNLRKQPLFPLEGLQLVSEALDLGLQPVAALVSQALVSSPVTERISTLIGTGGGRFAVASERIIQWVSATEQSQGLLCLFRKPKRPKVSEVLEVPKIILVLADVQDPGNCGALARSHYAFGGHLLVTVGETADPMSPKAMRASAGACFCLHIFHYRSASSFLESEEFRAIPLLGTIPIGGLSPGSYRPRLPAAILIGNEGSGLSTQLLAACDEVLSIPTSKKTQSLNAAVAGSLLLYELSHH